MAPALPRLLLVFGLRGTLLERLHHSNAMHMPLANRVTMGHSVMWLRKDVTPVLQRLSKTCDIAIYSSTTRKNVLTCTNVAFGPEASGSGCGHVPLSFIWSREQTMGDDFVRSGVQIHSDQKNKDDRHTVATANGSSKAELEHATLLDLNLVWKAFGETKGYLPSRTVLLDDNMIKCRGFADHFVCVPSCATRLEAKKEERGGQVNRMESRVAGVSDAASTLLSSMSTTAALDGRGSVDDDTMLRIEKLVNDTLLPAADVRDLMPIITLPKLS